jgi:ElaB/YqjD/DUF883 family membrane-anchored ribosome-binding protein
MEITNSTTPRDLKNEINATAQNVKSQAKDALRDMSGSWKESAENAYSMIQERGRQAADVSEDFVKRHPFTTVLGAAAIGLVAGFLLARRD